MSGKSGKAYKLYYYTFYIKHYYKVLKDYLIVKALYISRIKG
jgi:hypothetical protein